MNQFYLMHKNDTVATIEIRTNGTDGLFHIVELINPTLLPFGARNATTETIDELLSDWYDSRCVPSGRPNCDKVYEKLNSNTSFEFIQHSYMCSLTDCYWFKPTTSSITWEEVNFHKNGFTIS